SVEFAPRYPIRAGAPAPTSLRSKGPVCLAAGQFESPPRCFLCCFYKRLYVTCADTGRRPNCPALMGVQSCEADTVTACSKIVIEPLSKASSSNQDKDAGSNLWNRTRA